MSGTHGQPGLDQCVGVFDLDCDDSSVDDLMMTLIDLFKNEYFRSGGLVISFGLCVVFCLWVGLSGDRRLCKEEGDDCLVERREPETVGYVRCASFLRYGLLCSGWVMVGLNLLFTFLIVFGSLGFPMERRGAAHFL